MSRPAPPTDEQLAPLEVLAELFATDFTRGSRPAVAVGVVTEPAEAELHVRELHGEDPVRLLLGFSAPPEWTVFGLASRARLRHLEPTGAEAEAEAAAAADGAGFAHLSTRSGGFAFAIARDHDETLVRSGSGPSAGRVPDTCRRVLGLPTPPPAFDSRQLMAVQWLDALAARALAEPAGSLAWSDVVATNPQARRIAAVDPALAAQIPDHLDELGNAFRRGRPWAELRAEHAAGRLTGFDLDPAHSAWMDDGMFARWALDHYPPLDHLLEIVAERLTCEINRRVGDTLRSWDVEVDL